jgi:hypothetical protein
MSLVIDRNENIIVNANGKAHRTGFVAIGFHGMTDQVTLSEGKGYHRTSHNRTIHHTNQNGSVLWRGNRADLTFALFQSLTGWKD